MRTLDMNTGELVEVAELVLDKFGCDCFGNYWGEGLPLWNAVGATIDLHIRAQTKENAKAILLKMFPDVVIYNGV